MGCPDTGCIGYELTSDLSFDSSASWHYVGYDAIFEGNGYTLSNLYINAPDVSRKGLFGLLLSNGVIRNLTLSSVDVTGDDAVGGLVGTNQGGAIANVTVSGTVTGVENVGALVGDNNGGEITNSTSSGTVTGTGTAVLEDNVGGLVGRNIYGGEVTNSSSDATVTGHDDVGGLVGFNNAIISSSSSSGAVTGERNVGGLVGYHYGFHSKGAGSITNSSNSGTVTGEDNVGGLVGYNNGPVTNSSSSGTVSGYDDVGGLSGYNDGPVTNSSSSGAVSGYEDIGGLAGYNSDSITDSNSTSNVTAFKSFGALTGYNSGTITNSQGTGTVTQLPGAATASVTDAGLVSWEYELASGVSFSYVQVRWIEKPASGTPNWGNATKHIIWDANASSYQITGLTSGTEYAVRLFFGLSDSSGFKQVKADAGSFTPSG